VMIAADYERAVGDVMLGIMDGWRVKLEGGKLHRPFQQQLKLRGEMKVRFYLVPFRNAGADRLWSVVRTFKIHLQLDLSTPIERQRLPGDFSRLYRETLRIHKSSFSWGTLLSLQLLVYRIHFPYKGLTPSAAEPSRVLLLSEGS